MFEFQLKLIIYRTVLPLGSFKPTPTPLPQKTHERYPQMLKLYGLLPPHSAYYVIRFLALINVSSWEGLVY